MHKVSFGAWCSALLRYRHESVSPCYCACFSPGLWCYSNTNQVILVLNSNPQHKAESTRGSSPAWKPAASSTSSPPASNHRLSGWECLVWTSDWWRPRQSLCWKWWRASRNIITSCLQSLFFIFSLFHTWTPDVGGRIRSSHCSELSFLTCSMQQEIVCFTLLETLGVVLTLPDWSARGSRRSASVHSSSRLRRMCESSFSLITAAQFVGSLSHQRWSLSESSSLNWGCFPRFWWIWKVTL